MAASGMRLLGRPMSTLGHFSVAVKLSGNGTVDPTNVSCISKEVRNETDVIAMIETT
jgi:hypothetical protein